MPAAWGQKGEQQTLHRPSSRAERGRGAERASSEPSACHGQAGELPGVPRSSARYLPSERGDGSQTRKEKRCIEFPLSPDFRRVKETLKTRRHQ